MIESLPPEQPETQIQPPLSQAVPTVAYRGQRIFASGLVLLFVILLCVLVILASPSLRSQALSIIRPMVLGSSPTNQFEQGSPTTQVPPDAPVIVDASQATPAGIAAVVDGSNQSGLDLYAQLQKSPGNIFFSPLSISEALAMVYEGARGQTATEVQSAFHLPTDDTARRSGFAALYNQLNTATSTYELNIANALWVQKDYTLLPDYTNTVERYYGGEANSLDFKNNSTGAIDTINQWISGETAGKIPQLLSLESLNSSTRLVLTDAIYFKGKWETPFDPSLTQKSDFYVGPTQSVSVPMMQGTESFPYTETFSLQALELPYEGNNLSMLILLPENNDLHSIEQSLTLQEIHTIQQSLELQQVQVYVPKFTFSTSYMLNNLLSSMGITSAFDPNDADFSGMDGKTDLYIGSAVHKAYIEVDEEGTEAAAATAVAVSMEVTSVSLQPPVFLANHPFLFLIQDNRSGAILFLGRVDDPSVQ